jgi:ribosomal protein S18 acetylase RimI-like enzyme
LNIKIRKFEKADIEAIISLIPRFSDFELPEWRKPEDITNKTNKQMQEVLNNSSAEEELFIAEENEKVIGFILLQTRKDFFTGESQGYISDIAVKKEYEGNGVGRLLLGKAEEWARGKGYQLIVLHTLIGNERAKRIYEKFGFKKDNIQYAKKL